MPLSTNHPVLDLLVWLSQQKSYVQFFAGKWENLVKFFFLGALIGSMPMENDKKATKTLDGFRLVEMTQLNVTVCQKNVTTGNDLCFILFPGPYQKIQTKLIIDRMIKRNFLRSKVERVTVNYCKKSSDIGMAILQSMIFCEVDINPVTKGGEISSHNGMEINDKTLGLSRSGEYAKKYDEKHHIKQLVQNLTTIFDMLQDTQLMSLVLGVLLVMKSSRFTIHLGARLNECPSTLLLQSKTEKKQYTSINFESGYENFGSISDNSETTKKSMQLTQLYLSTVGGKYKNEFTVVNSLSESTYHYMQYQNPDRFYMNLLEMLDQASSLDVVFRDSFFKGYFQAQDWKSRNIRASMVSAKQKTFLHLSLGKNDTEKCVFVDLNFLGETGTLIGNGGNTTRRVNKSCLLIIVSGHDSSSKDPKSNEPVITFSKKLRVVNGRTKSLLAFPDILGDKFSTVLEQVDKIPDTLNKICFEMTPENSCDCLDLLNGLVAASPSNLVVTVHPHTLFIFEKIQRTNWKTVLVITSDTSKERKPNSDPTLIGYLTQNIDCNNGRVSIPELKFNFTNKTTFPYTDNCNFIYVNASNTKLEPLKQYCTKQKTTIEPYSKSQTSTLQTCPNGYDSKRCENFTILVGVVENIRTGFEETDLSSMPNIFPDCKHIFFDDISYKHLAYADAKFNRTSSYMKMTDFCAQTPSPSVLINNSSSTSIATDQYNVGLNLVDLHNIFNICRQELTIESRHFHPKISQNTTHMVIKKIGFQNSKVIQAYIDSNHKTIRASCLDIKSINSSKLINQKVMLLQNDFCFSINYKTLKSVHRSITCQHTSSKTTQSLKFNMVPNGNTVLHQNVTANGTTHYHVDLAKQNSMFQIYIIRSAMYVKSYHVLIVDCPILSIINITRQLSGTYDKNTVTIDIRQEIIIKIFVQKSKYGSIDLTLVTQGGFQIVLVPEVNILYHNSPSHVVSTETSTGNDFLDGHNVKSSTLSLLRSQLTILNHFSAVFTNKMLQTLHLSIEDHEKQVANDEKKVYIYVTDTEAQLETFIHSTVERNIFRINASCEAIPGYEILCNMKSVYIQVDQMTSFLQLVTFKELCWMLKELGSELTLHLVKHDDQIILILFKLHTETHREDFIGTVIILGQLEHIVANLAIELETMFSLSIRGNDLTLQPRKIFVPSSIRFIVMQPESAVRPVWYTSPRSNVIQTFVKLDFSLLIELSDGFPDDESSSVAFLCYDYFEHPYAFPNVALEFDDQVIFVKKNVPVELS